MMKGSDIVIALMKEQGITQVAMAEKMGYRTQSSVRDRLVGKHDMRVDTLVNFLRVLDCDLVVRDHKTGKEWMVTDQDQSQGQDQGGEVADRPSEPDKKGKLTPIEELLRAGAITPEQAIAAGWVPSVEMLDKMLNS